MQLQDLCMGCMAETGGAAVCPLCGFAESQATTGGGLYLPPRTVLNGRYVIGRVLGQGGFGIIYLALDATLNLKVAIKEFLPRELAARGADGVSVSVYQDQARQLFAYGLEQFLAEVRTLARLSEHQGIVTVRDFFTANGTGYLAMSYLDGITLKDYVARKGGRLPFLTGFRALLPVMDALREVHALGLLHRDISPDNIYLTRDNQVKLIDFGAARMALSERSKSLSVIFKPGFAPEEQYRSKGHQGPWTDVYALAGTLYYAITGHVPSESLDRLAEDTLSPPSALGVDIPPAAEAVLLKALAVRAAGRYPTVEAFQQELMRTATNRKEQEASPAPVVQTQWEQPVTPVARPVKPVVKPEKSSFEKKWLFAAGGIGVVGILILLLTQKPAPPPTPDPDGAGLHRFQFRRTPGQRQDQQQPLPEACGHAHRPSHQPTAKPRLASNAPISLSVRGRPEFEAGIPPSPRITTVTLSCRGWDRASARPNSASAAACGSGRANSSARSSSRRFRYRPSEQSNTRSPGCSGTGRGLVSISSRTGIPRKLVRASWSGCAAASAALRAPAATSRSRSRA